MIPARTAVRVEGIAFRLKKVVGGGEAPYVDVALGFVVKGELAEAMGAGIFEHCFVRGRGEGGAPTFNLRDEVGEIAFRLPDTQWRMALYAAEDQPRAVVEVPDVIAERFKVKRDKDGLPCLDAKLVLSAELPPAGDVYRLINHLGTTLYIEFTDDQGYLFESLDDQTTGHVSFSAPRVAPVTDDERDADTSLIHSGEVMTFDGAKKAKKEGKSAKVAAERG